MSTDTVDRPVSAEEVRQNILNGIDSDEMQRRFDYFLFLALVDLNSVIKFTVRERSRWA